MIDAVAVCDGSFLAVLRRPGRNKLRWISWIWQFMSCSLGLWGQVSGMIHNIAPQQKFHRLHRIALLWWLPRHNFDTFCACRQTLEICFEDFLPTRTVSSLLCRCALRIRTLLAITGFQVSLSSYAAERPLLFLLSIVIFSILLLFQLIDFVHQIGLIFLQRF